MADKKREVAELMKLLPDFFEAQIPLQIFLPRDSQPDSPHRTLFLPRFFP
jgi:hypothetical protein